MSVENALNVDDKSGHTGGHDGEAFVHNPANPTKRIVLKGDNHSNKLSRTVCVAIVRPGLENLYRAHTQTTGFQVFDYGKVYTDASVLICPNLTSITGLASVLTCLLTSEALYTRFYFWVRSRSSNNKFVIFNPTRHSESSLSKLCSNGAMLNETEDQISSEHLSQLPCNFCMARCPEPSATLSCTLISADNANDTMSEQENKEVIVAYAQNSTVVMPHEGWSSRVKNYSSMYDVVIILLGGQKAESISTFTDCGFDIYNEWWFYEKAAQLMLSNSNATTIETKSMAYRVRQRARTFFQKEYDVFVALRTIQTIVEKNKIWVQIASHNHLRIV